MTNKPPNKVEDFLRELFEGDFEIEDDLVCFYDCSFFLDELQKRYEKLVRK